MNDKQIADLLDLGLDPSVSVDGAVVRAAEADVAAVWKPGNVILDTYEVKQRFKGGMGRVYRVHHRDWNIDLAVKSPRRRYFTTETHKEYFVRECETWIGLGLHPNIVTCYYVRTLGGIPRVFAEYVEGGSLADWINDRRLYEGGPEQALARMLDIAIQFAWGLQYAQEQGLVHQDAKPANVLITPEGEAKVTDFGLARARAAAGEVTGRDHQQGNVVSVAGRTREYCSPEQGDACAMAEAGVAREKLPRLSPQTDIWSWGLSILEMFAGKLLWKDGRDARDVLASYLKTDAEDTAIPKMPESLAALLKHCFQRNPDDRPRNMREVIARLREVYQQTTGGAHERPDPKPIPAVADVLNNQAISLLDLGKQQEAEQLLDKAHQADAHHPEAAYNRGLLHWRSGRMTDEQLVTALEEVRKFHVDEWRVEYLLALVHIERGDAESAVKLLEEAIRQAPSNSAVQQAMSLARSGKGCWRRCVRTFEGHTGRVYPVCFSRDGRWAMSGSDDRTLRLWEVSTGHCLRKFEEHRGRVHSVCFNPDGQWVLSGSLDSTLRLWQVSSGCCLRTFKGHTEEVLSVCLSPDGRWALSGGDDRTLRLWEVSSGRCMRTFEGHTERVSSACFSPDGRRALSASWDRTVRLWEVSSGRCLQSFVGHTSIVSSAHFSPDGRWALSASWDRTVRLWEVSSGRCLRSFAGHTSSVNSAHFSPDGRWALSGGDDRTLRLWDVSSGRCMRTFEGHTGDIHSACFHPDGQWALSGSTDLTLRLWEISKTAEPVPFVPARPAAAESILSAYQAVHRQLTNAREFWEAGNRVAALASLRQAREVPGFNRDSEILALWNGLALRGSRTSVVGAWTGRLLEGHTSRVYSACFSTDGQWALSGDCNKALRLWEVSSGRCLRVLEGHTTIVCSVCFSPDGQRALSGGADHSLRLWEVSTGQCLRTLNGHTGYVLSVCFSPEGRWVLSGSVDKTLRLWDVSSQSCVRSFVGHRSFVNSVHFSPDGRWALSGGGDKTLRLWDVSSGCCLRTLEGHTGDVYSVCISPDGRLALSGSGDNTMRLWEVFTGRCLRAFEGHTAYVRSVCFSPDGRWALSGSLDKTMRLWEVSGGCCLWTFEGHLGHVFSGCFSPDGRRALSAGDENTLRLWELDWDWEVPEARDWDEGTRPYLEIFLTLHCRYSRDGLSRVSMPSWADADFERLLQDLQYRGYGWLRPEGVRRELEKMTREWQGPPPLP